MNYYSIPSIIAFTINLSIAFIVLSHNYKKTENILLFLYIFSFAAWDIGDFIMINSKTHYLADIGAKIGLAGFFFSSVFFLHFSAIFPRKISNFFNSKKRVALFYLLPSLFLAFVFSSMKIRLEKIKEFGNIYYYHHVVADQPLSFYISYIALSSFILIFSLIGISNLISSLKRKNTAREKTQIKYLITGITLMVLFGLGIDLTNHFLKLGLPLLYLFSTYSILISLFFAVAVLRLHLLDIYFIIRGGVSYFILSGTVTAIYILLIKNLGEIIGRKTHEGSILVESLLIILIVILSRPLMKATEYGVDRIFYRGRHSLKRKIEEFYEFLVDNINLNEITTEIVNFLKKQLDVKKVAIFLLNKKSKKYEIVNSFNLSIQFKISTSDEMIKFIKNFKLPIEGEFLKSIYKKSKVVPILFKEKISLILPLLHKDQVQGMILLGNKLSKKGWSQKELDLLSLFSKHASAALSRAVMAEELKEAERIMARSQKLIALGELSAGIAHEIRNPLGIISASAETLQKNHINNKTRKEISKFILDEVNRLNKFINNFLNFARPSKPHFSFFNIRDVIKKCAALIYDKATKQNIKIIINCDPKISSIYSDQHQLGQLLINLMLNSIEAMPNGGEIKITSRISGKNKLAIEIQDTGCGISPDIREKIFNPFFTTKERGTGLGLSVASRIAQNLGGMLSFDSEEGRGTIFRIYLPIKHES